MTAASILLYAFVGLSFAIIGVAWRSAFLIRAGRRNEAVAPLIRATLLFLVAALIGTALGWIILAVPALIGSGPAPQQSAPPTSPSPSPSVGTSPSAVPTVVTQADGFSALSPQERLPGEVVRYGNSHFQSRTGNWRPGEFTALNIHRIQGLGTTINGCSVLRQIKYPGLGTGPKSLTFSAAMGSSGSRTSLLGKVQMRANDQDPWSAPLTFQIAVGEFGPFSFDVDGADEVLVSIYADPAGNDCANVQEDLVYFDDSVTFR